MEVLLPSLFELSLFREQAGRSVLHSRLCERLSNQEHAHLFPSEAKRAEKPCSFKEATAFLEGAAEGASGRFVVCEVLQIRISTSTWAQLSMQKDRSSFCAFAVLPDPVVRFSSLDLHRMFRKV
jgi:hypothetical protein